MAGEKKQAIKELKTGLEKFQEESLEKDWEQDEVDEKIKEVFESKYDIKYSIFFCLHTKICCLSNSTSDWLID